MNPVLDQLSDDELKEYVKALKRVSEARVTSRRIGVSGLTDEELDQIRTNAEAEAYWRNRRMRAE